jgi:ATP-binding cassette subfamily C protein CydC
MKPLARILGLWRRQAFALALGLVIALVSLAYAVGLMAAAGGLLVGAATASALRYLGVARVLVRYAERLATHSATFRALADLRVWFFRRLSVNAAGGLGFRRAGDVLSRLVGDVEALDGLYLRILVPLAGAVLLFPALVVFAVRVTPLAGVAVALCFAAAAFALPALAARLTRTGGASLARAQAALRVAVLDSLVGLKEVRAYGAEGRVLATVQARDAAMLSAQHRLASGTAYAGAASFLCGQLALLVLLLVAGAAPAAAVIALFLSVAAFEAVGGLIRAGALAGHATAAATRILEVADAPAPVPDPAAPKPLPPANAPALRFEAVSFGWLRDRPPIFDSLTLDVPAGARVAVLGPSGAGKSTLAALALKLAAPWSGRVMLAGADIAESSAAEVRASIGWLAQDTHLFDDTIRANLLLARPGADEAELWAALEAARLADVVHALPDRLDTWIGESGARLSGGQGRRLALARTLLSPASVLILDEPAAGLDAETERQFHETLNATANDRTVVLIAHRLTGAERLDRIWRLSASHAVAAAG